VHFYKEPLALANPSLPHQHFLLTDQVALDIDRGLGFLDWHTRHNRDTYINYQNRDEAQALLDSYAGGRLVLP
jgi:hypothetical protein